MNHPKLTVRPVTACGVTAWFVYSPNGGSIGAMADRVDAINWARKIAEQWAYELEFGRIVEAVWGVKP